MSGFGRLWHWRFFRWRAGRWLGIGLLFFLWLGALSAQAASNALPSPAGHLDDQVLAVDVNQFKPPECAGIDIENLVVAGGSGNAVNGTDRNDLILGTGGSDRLYGGAGDDCIVAGGGDDGEVWLWLFGWPIFPTTYLYGEEGNDVILGGSGEDVMDGGPGDDALYGAAGRDVLKGDDGNDYLDGGSGTDYCNGGGGDDTIVNCETP